MIGVLVLHGIGEQGPGYADAFIAGVERFLKTEARWEPVVYADLLPSSAEEDWSELNYHCLRRLLAQIAFDIDAYKEPETYAEVHERVGRAYFELVDRGVSHIAILSHSWGTIVANDYAWDNLVAVDLMVTFGSPLARHLKPVRDPVPIEFTRWVNLYDPNDPIAFPLHLIGSDYASRIEDTRVRVGRAPLNALPLNHTAYWRDRGFHRLIADYLDALDR